MRSSRNVFVVAAALVVLALIGLGIYQWRTGDGEPPVAEPPQTTAPEEQAAPEEPAWCPAAELVSVPGTWESAPEDDPFSPHANPQSFMLSITAPLQQQYDQKRLRVFTVPYTAQFKNIQSPQARAEMSYDDSRAEGTAKLKGELAHVARECSQTKFIIAGFSQGAVIVGDVAAEIGHGNGPIPPERLAGAVMVADGRRENGVGVNPGAEVGGVGAEIALQPLQGVANRVTPGATLTGPRPGGFGEVSDRAFEICAPNDTVCDAPADLGTAIGRAQALIAANGVHAMYATNPEAIPGTTAPEWTLNWVRTVVDSL